MSLALLVVAGLALAAPPCPATAPAAPIAQDPAPPSQEDFVAWVQESAIPVAHLDWRREAPLDFSWLDQALEGKRIVYLGESDHWVAQRMEFRLVLIRELARRGYRRIGMEMGLSDSKRIDRYLETGDEAWLEKVALYGYRQDLRTDREDIVPGWTDELDSPLLSNALAESRWFLTELRAMNEALAPGAPRLRWFGYDLSFRPGGGYADARALLAPHEGEALVRLVLERLARVPGENRLEEADRLERVVGVIDQGRGVFRRLLGAQGLLELRRSIQRMADAFRFIDGMQGLRDFDPKQIGAALAARERRMEHNFDEHLAEWPEGEKLILLGHALHLSQDSPNIEEQAYGRMWRSIGTYLARELPGEVYGIWAMHRRGRHGRPRAEPLILPLRAPAGAVEHVLAEAGPRFVLPLHSGDPREAWLQQKRSYTFHGAAGRMVLPDQVDCVFFLEVATPPGERPVSAEGSPRRSPPR